MTAQVVKPAPRPPGLLIGFTFEGEGPGFARRENQILMFQRMTAFLERHLFA